MNDSDEFLLDLCQKKRKLDLGLSSPSNECLNTSIINVAAMTSPVQFHIQTYSITDFNEWISRYAANSIFYLAGSTTNSVVKHVCIYKMC